MIDMVSLVRNNHIHNLLYKMMVTTKKMFVNQILATIYSLEIEK